MQELFGLSMTGIMIALLAIFVPAMLIVAALANWNRIMVKFGLRSIPRRPAQTALIIVGVMLSTVITSAAFGTGDTLSFSIRNIAVEQLGTIDQVLIAVRAGENDSFGAESYIPYSRFEELQSQVADIEGIDGIMPQLAETVPVVDSRTSLSAGLMRFVGLEPTLLAGFGEFVLISGGTARLSDVAFGEAYINTKAEKELEAKVGDDLRVFLKSGPVIVKVKGIVERGGLAGADPTMIFPLAHAQELLDRQGEINLIVVSNDGEVFTDEQLAEDVTTELRSRFTDREVVAQLQAVLNRESVQPLLSEHESGLRGRLEEDFTELLAELKRESVSDRLVSLLADAEVSGEVFKALDQDDPGEEIVAALRELFTLSLDLAEFRILNIKHNLLAEADEAGSGVTSFFMIMGSFSIMVGVLLIFLIFVMLAAARRSEMGMARAVGAKRRHLVQMFLFEGTAYALMSAAAGVLLGLIVSAIMVTALNRIFAGFDDDFRLVRHFEPRSIVVAYALGMAITFATVAVSAVRVSRLNIVAAVRGLPTPITITTTGWRDIFTAPVRAVVSPFMLLWKSAIALVTLHPVRSLGYLVQAFWTAISIPGSIGKAIVRIIARLFMQGWLPFVAGIGLVWWGLSIDRLSLFTGGVSLVIVGIGLMLRTVLRRTSMRSDRRDRIAFSFMGITMLVFWVVPFDSVLEDLLGRLEGDFEMVFVSGLAMVAAAVWTVMYNADYVLRAVTFFSGRVGRLRPVVVTAVAYPLSSKFRTGLTLAMFALVIFTLVVMSILSSIFGTQFATSEEIHGGWHINGSVNSNTPIEDINAQIASIPDLRTEDFVGIGGYTRLSLQARQKDGEEQSWRRIPIRAVDDPYLAASKYDFKLIADGYGPEPEDVWSALSRDPTLAVAGGGMVPTEAGGEEDWRPIQVEGLHYQDESMSPVTMEVRDPRSGALSEITLIGVLDRIHESQSTMFTSNGFVDGFVPFPVPITNYRFAVAKGVDQKEVAQTIEKNLLEHGMETEVLEEVLKEEAAAARAIFRLFIGFMALGLLVGIAALGVVSMRAVVERRQEIGVLRAIGYRRSMIQLSFLFESSFIALSGIFIGVVLGTILSYNAFLDIRAQEGLDTLRFSVPWIQIAIIVVGAYIFSLLTTFMPARQASRIYPAEALRYE